MKQTPEYDHIQQQMQPGVITLEGFLGPDKRHLIDILVEDDGTVRRLERSHEQIAKKMEYFRSIGLPGLGEFITVDDTFDVRVDSVRGKLPSPFGGAGMYDKVNTTVLNKRLNREITFTDLHIHFIRDHGFYEGKNSIYRLEPHHLIEILEIEKLEGI